MQIVTASLDRRIRRGAAAAGAAGLLVVAIALGTAGTGHAAENWPLFPGEELNYRMRVSGLGTVAMGKMTVTGPTSLRGIPSLLFTSEFRSGVAIVGGRDRTRSWVEQAKLRVLRYEKSEGTAFSRREEAVDVFPDDRRWVGGDGKGGRTPTDAPLDELSFIYFIRTLPLAAGGSYRFDHHFEADGRRLPLRIESEVLNLGRTVITLESHTHPPMHASRR